MGKKKYLTRTGRQKNPKIECVCVVFLLCMYVLSKEILSLKKK